MADDLASPADAAVARPNIVFVLTDDLAWNLVKYMPHVVEMQKQGTTFSKYFVTDSLCCPSRSSIFTGMYPHDTGVFTNSGDMGGYGTYEAHGDQQKSFAVLLHGSGYQTAMMGKFLNGYSPTENQADPGWGEWDVAGNGYPEFNYQLNENGVVNTYGMAATDYLVDVMAGLGVKFIKSAGASPFVIELATFAPHAPYTPAPRYLNTFHEKLPRTPAFNTSNTNPPNWLEDHPVLKPKQVALLDSDFNLRVEAVQAVDDLIASLRATLTAQGIDQNTYIVFSSDNGYHMGDHTLLAGKQTAFDHDINVPLIVVGPGVPAGVTVDALVENIDLCPTFAEIAGVPAPPTVDGHSLLGLMTGQTPSDWRQATLVEHKGPDFKPIDPANDPDVETDTATPNSYEALRTVDSLYVEYQDKETEYYDLTTDPYELSNTVGSLTAARVKRFHEAISAIKNCHDSASCWAAQKVAP